MALNSRQQAHLAKVFPESREQMAQYLQSGVEVVVYLQSECRGDVPPYAVAPKDNQEFWIGCWGSVESASREACALGLKVVSD